MRDNIATIIDLIFHHHFIKVLNIVIVKLTKHRPMLVNLLVIILLEPRMVKIHNCLNFAFVNSVIVAIIIST